MKEGWEYKKIKDVALVVGGSTPKTNIDSYWGEGHFWVTPAELDGSKYISKTVRTITDKAVEKTNLSLLPVGTVLLSSRAPIGKVCITKKTMYCNQGFKNLVCGERLYNEYAYYFLKHNVSYIQSLGTGATFKEISKKVVEGIEIPVPPLSEQQHIVEELDLLSSIIEKKKAQLKELDNLAQSIFYEMFGDPITNEKGWDKEKMNNLCTITSSKRIFANEYCEEGVPFYRGKEITELSKDQPLSTELNISQKRFDELKKEFGVPSIGDILITAVGTIGNIWVVSDDREFYFKDGNIIWLKDIKGFNPVFFRKLLSILIDAFKSEMAQGCAYNALTIVNLKRMKALCPPLPLQELFASKIQSIEHQKALIKQSITEVETLFNSRMDYYFN